MTDEQFSIIKNLLLLVVKGIGYLLSNNEVFYKQYLSDIEKAL